MRKTDVAEIQAVLWIIMALLARGEGIGWLMWVGIVAGSISMLGSVMVVDEPKSNSTLLDAMSKHNKGI